METKLKQIYQIETDTKLDKLTEERREFNREYRLYMEDQTDENMHNMILELIDVIIVVLQLAVCKHGMYMAEIRSMAREKVHTSMKVLELMKKRHIGYNKARRIVRGNR